MGPGLTKKGLPFQSDSLLGMALYDFDTLAADVGLHSSVNLPSRHNSHDAPPAFHPVDEYKDLSLKEILDLSDDFLSNDDDLLLGHCNNNGHNSERAEGGSGLDDDDAVEEEVAEAEDSLQAFAHGRADCRRRV